MKMPENNFSPYSSSNSTPSSSLPLSSVVVDDDDCDDYIISNVAVMMKPKKKQRRGTSIAILIPIIIGISCFGGAIINQRRLQTFSSAFPFQSQQIVSSWMDDQDDEEDQRLLEEAELESANTNPMELEEEEDNGDGSGGGVGACLLIKDDNHWLVEWLAFHYHVMPLRHLIVVVDPQSKTSPLNILRRYTDTNLMTIEVWQDDDFMPKNPGKNMRHKYGNNTNLMNHRLRQGTFYTQCIEHFKYKRMGVSWVYLTDTDEFTSLNYNYGDNTQEATPAQQLIQQHPIEEPGSVLSFLREHQQQTSQTQPCLYLNRYMVGSVDSSPEVVQKYTANGTQFLTQRFLKHKPKHSPVGKNMVHLNALPYDDLQLQPDVHRVSKYCPAHSASTHLESSHYIKINHYIGTSEQYFFRTDPRATKGNGQADRWQRDSSHYYRLGKDANVTDTTSQAWIQGFIDSVGMDVAQTLLEGVGQIEGWKQYHPPKPRKRQKQKQKQETTTTTTKKKKKSSAWYRSDTTTTGKKQSQTGKNDNYSEQEMTTITTNDVQQQQQQQQQPNATESHYLRTSSTNRKQDDDKMEYAVGDQVYKISKLKKKFSGPYTIEQLHTHFGKVTLRLSPKTTQTIDIGLISRRRPKKKKKNKTDKKNLLRKMED